MWPPKKMTQGSQVWLSEMTSMTPQDKQTYVMVSMLHLLPYFPDQFWSAEV
jgi:hypothetical protein